ncbi:MAG: YchJ family protein [Cycloclasticus sp.]
MSSALCRCGSGKIFTQCCQPFINRSSLPSTAEQLMRSRFTAFALVNIQYLSDTHYPSKRSANELHELQQNSLHTSWIELTILDTQDGLSSDSIGTVAFTAVFYANQQYFELVENSSFIKENQQWFYIEGIPTVQSIHYKIKRNEPCWCLSDKKYKHCHALL